VELLPLVEDIDWDCRSDCSDTSDFETCSTTLPSDCISEWDSEHETDAAESDIGAELESNCDLSDDSDELESDEEVMFPARCMCIHDLGAMLEENFPERTLCLEVLPLVQDIDWGCRSDCSDNSEE
jgi:hypothetical protein